MIPKIQKILYATDLSPNSVYALRYAMNAAIKHGAEVVILHVLEDVDPASRVMLDIYIDEKRHKKIAAEQTAEAQKRIQNRLRTIRDRELKNHSEFADNVISIEVCEGFPAEKILSKAEELNCDEIILGTHSKGIIANTFLGSTAKRVLHRTRKPVFIIPLPKGETDITFDDK
ncbi:MAG: universal stress protein [Desulfobacteraceae bacterium]|jgi:nucleotide-binding universal stress UspA family protein|nr:universal stress protein [Desulfobacteraceae bacterium]